MNKTKTSFIIVFILSIASVSNAVNIVYVDVNGPNDPGSGLYTDPFRRIQDAIDAAQAGDTIEIRPGVYTGVGNYDLDPNGKSITVRSINPEDAGVVANTIIDPNKAGRGFNLHSGEDADCIIAGLTIRNAYTVTGYNGAGIYCDNSRPAIVNCIITGNFAEGYGCGVSCTNSNAQIRNCTISNGRGRYGGGVGCLDSSGITITNCTIVRNTAIFSGGGVFCDMNSHVVISSSIIWANKLDYPEEEYGPQVCLFGGSSATISYTNIEEGLDGVSSIESTLYWLSGNMNADPCFASFDPNGDPNFWDLHLQSEYGRWNPNSQGWVCDVNTSPCIDVGDPNSDWAGEPWPNGKRINMGAYGGTNQASKNGNIADFDVNGVVNSSDLMEFSSKWLDENGSIVNLNLTGGVDFRDFAIFAKNWLWEK